MLDRFFARSPASVPPALAERLLARLKQEAEAVIRHEPDMGGHMFAAVMKHASLASVVIQRLASRLGHVDVPSDLLRQTFSRLATAEPRIEAAFVADLIAVLDRDPACLRFLEPVLYFKGFQALQAHRFANALWRQGRLDLAQYIQSRASSVFQVDIHPAATLGQGLMLDHATGLVVTSGVVIEDEVSILHNVSIGVSEGAGATTIGWGTSLGAGTKVLDNVAIGSCVRVAAGSVVTASVASNHTIAGSPARIVAAAACPEATRTFEELLATKLEPVQAPPSRYPART